MPSLVFRALDHHVVHGLADDAAIADERGTMSYAQLLHESASLAGALLHMGVEPGSTVVVDVPSRREVVSVVMACARVGALPGDTGAFRVAGSPPVLHTPDTQVTWDVLIAAGRTDPAPAPDQDPDGYEDALREVYGDVVSTLLDGGTVQ